RRGALRDARTFDAATVEQRADASCSNFLQQFVGASPIGIGIRIRIEQANFVGQDGQLPRLFLERHALDQPLDLRIARVEGGLRLPEADVHQHASKRCDLRDTYTMATRSTAAE